MNYYDVNGKRRDVSLFIGFDSTRFPVALDNHRHDCSDVTVVSMMAM